MRGNWYKRIGLMLAVTLLMLPLVQRGPQRQMTVLAEEITTQTDLKPAATDVSAPAETPTPRPEAERRSGYVRVGSGTTLWSDRACTVPLGRVSGTAYVWTPRTKVEQKAYLVNYDTKASRHDPIFQEGYVRSRDVRWLSDEEETDLVKKLKRENARLEGELWIPVIQLWAIEEEETPEPTPTEAPATEKPTEAPATKKPTAAPATEKPAEAPATKKPTAAPATEKPAEAPTASPTAAPEPTPEDDATDLAPVRTAVPAPQATLVPPMPTQDGIATPCDLATGTDLAAAQEDIGITDEQMRSMLDEYFPDRKLLIRYECAQEPVGVGSEVTLHAEVLGYDGLTYRVIWEVDRQDGAGWVSVAGPDDMKRIFTVTEENICWQWRIGVKMPYIDPME